MCLCTVVQGPFTVNEFTSGSIHIVTSLPNMRFNYHLPPHRPHPATSPLLKPAFQCEDVDLMTSSKFKGQTLGPNTTSVNSERKPQRDGDATF